MNKTPKLGKGLGRKPDKRDLILPRLAHLSAAAQLPSRADVFLGLDNLPVYDQGELSNCTANAGVLYRRPH